MRVLILGGNGMLGHQLLKYLGENNDVRVTLRQELHAYSRYNLFNEDNAYPDVEVTDYNRVSDVISEFVPEAVVNVVGIIKQRHSSNDRETSIELNALFPHKLAKLCHLSGSRLVHISTDCVFSGKKGNYNEGDLSDAEDVYGKTKYLGEVNEKGAITLRTSIIGRELSRKASLLEWFLSQKKGVTGFKKAIFSGLTTIEMSRVIERVLVDYPDKYGIYHVSSSPISKYELLKLINSVFSKQLIIEEDDKFICDRSLNSDKFRSEFQYSPPTWQGMIEELLKYNEGY